MCVCVCVCVCVRGGGGGGVGGYLILEKHVIKMYPAEISLTALVTIFGTIQAALIAAFVVSSSSWKLHFSQGSFLLTLLLEVRKYCIRKSYFLTIMFFFFHVCLLKNEKKIKYTFFLTTKLSILKIN